MTVPYDTHFDSGLASDAYYGVLRDSAALVAWRHAHDIGGGNQANTIDWEARDLSHQAGYAVTLAESPAASGVYLADLAAWFANTLPECTLPAGRYYFEVRRQMGSTPDGEADLPPAATIPVDWDGTKRIYPGDLAAALAAILQAVGTRAAPGDAMDIVAVPNAAAVAAIQAGLAAAGDEMDLVDAPNATAIAAIVAAMPAPPAGSGNVPVDHNYGGTDELCVKTSAGVGVEGATIRAYLASEAAAGQWTVRGEAITGPDGRWLEPMMLTPGAYALTIQRPGSVATAASLTVEDPA